ncbi:GNAT family N-acetyltransferase [Jeotgalibacillus terrae]|uniref:GNAT family N-acetyltransferase n=1 Tax=Jeotgalibacillus terrae TaxID=587735 RepID=A0ABW5ZLJ8_9BACL|nr:GNAT family protein [Jeotgalibacillus terrae]MBM7578149.1 ribosomal-protein-serine acetyltransferase [Jeotgalibacillus terrae]
MFTYMINEDIELKLLETRHAEALFRLTDGSRSHLRTWLPWVDQTKSVENSKGFIEYTLKQFSSQDGFQAGIWYKGELAGVVGLHGINWTNRSTSIGYWLGEDFQGHGLMTQSCQAVISHCFNELNLKRIEIRAATENVSSQGVPERLGFKKEGCLEKSECLYGHYVDHYVYGLINQA